MALEGNRLVHYFKDNSDPSRPFQLGGAITDRATGPGCIIQSNIGDPGNFEVIVPEGSRLMHYFKDNSDVRHTFQVGGVITEAADAPAAIVQGRIGSPGNLEVIAAIGNRLAHWWKDPADLVTPWRFGYVLTTSGRGPGCIANSAFGSNGHFEVLAGE